MKIRGSTVNAKSTNTDIFFFLLNVLNQENKYLQKAVK
ncbi:hypothetical protein J577_1265 [Acinetobacter sp. 263903-1]|nr:hypothetical protein J559_2517 [Acinetobacter sp. 983759]KCX38024.1 hypothetical protein J577_1265 [Acinetobacter sp. 263903-1]